MHKERPIHPSVYSFGVNLRDNHNSLVFIVEPCLLVHFYYFSKLDNKTIDSCGNWLIKQDNLSQRMIPGPIRVHFTTY